MTETNEETSSKFHPLPCLFTIASLFCGFYSILAAFKGDYITAAYAILIAAIFDGLDGRVARMTGQTSSFGAELDSLCDMVSFGVAPALLAYLWALHPYGRYGWLAGFLYVATTALRLARFNTQASEENAPKNFVGLPCPAAAAMISSSVLFGRYLGIEADVRHISLLIMVYLLSYLMVSTHSYYSFKYSSKLAKTFQVLVGLVLLFIAVAAEPNVMLFVLFLVYVASGPFIAAFTRLRSLVTAGSKKEHDETAY
ncbi:MAG: CDP-diacylglycerol--serine O-phosphatidyltransferase [Desulfofustis sp.]|jgi:CDP-diacylglycerol--serine O-phosphatidyltransferase|nr:CDP-diacylglycerol--serine O-phosphatidyltransferase [Desulfofustis sp.]